MRTAHLSAPEDLTARALIRDAAIVHFAHDGFRKTSLRAIAASAGVSASLVVHHFGSKDNLRIECDEFVIGNILAAARDKSSPAGLQAVIQGYLANPAEYEVDVAYLSRAITEETTAGRNFVDSIVDETEAIIRAGVADGSMNPSSDPRAEAALITMTSLAMMTLSSHLARALGFEGRGLGQETMRRLALPSVELYTHGLYTDETVLNVTRNALAAAPESAAARMPSQEYPSREDTR
ncbi:TetR family transcriptional regulator [Cryobacterium zhongshanensis]|uniref:TetR family transcriptional regulator n=1 Tax=Cryobacterium zhongshanensis TaxID=2928153 RepID=A0AA41QWY6_9MICO|nr:TetR family transcriptional regulator [Cryobacterium zhongshanensis]MCI4659282.1 TetR family transcriptional regulator [Cryobacterium zhongshanensis]